MGLTHAFQRVKEYTDKGIWQIRLSEQPRLRALLIRVCRVLLLAVRGFRDDRCPLRASALTFYSLLSVVPVVAMLFGIAKGFGFQRRLEGELLEQFPEHQEVVARVVEFSQALLDSTRGGLIAGIGVLVLFWTVIKVLSTVENTFNDIWEVRQSRSIVRKFTDYLAIMLICPVNLVVSGSATVLVSVQVAELGQKLGLSEVVAPLLSVALWVLPYILVWILFAFIYVVMPNTRVRLWPGLVAAVLAGTAYQITQVLFVEFQVGVARYNAIYGSFAALPLFLIWLQVSWGLVLFGAEISHAIQTVEKHEFAPLIKKLSLARRRLLLLYVTHLSVKAFAAGDRPLTAREIARSLGIPDSLVHNALSDLVAAGVFSCTYRQDFGEMAYQPASDIGRFTIAYVIERLENFGAEDLPVKPTAQLEALSASLAEFQATLQACPANRLLSSL